jgi:hypothetical protein
MAGEGLPVQAATRVLNVTDSGYYAWRSRGPSARAVRHALATETIRQVHLASAGPTATAVSMPNSRWGAASSSVTAAWSC